MTHRSRLAFEIRSDNAKAALAKKYEERRPIKDEIPEGEPPKGRQQ
jgi:hypothetical protein